MHDYEEICNVNGVEIPTCARMSTITKQRQNGPAKKHPTLFSMLLKICIVKKLRSPNDNSNNGLLIFT